MNDEITALLDNWGNINNRINRLTEIQLKGLINYECSTRKRKSFIVRLHQRYSKLESLRVRQSLIEGSGML